MAKKYVKVGGELENIVGDGIIAAASKIKDYNKDKTQEEINTETDSALADRYTMAETNAQINAKLYELGAVVIDDIPRENSENLVRSGSVYDAYAHLVYLSEDDEIPTPAEFNPQADTVWNKSGQILSETQKKNIRANIGLGNGDIDDKPITDSDNLVNSGGVANSLISLADNLLELNDNDTGVQEITPEGTFKGLLRNNGTWTNTSETSSFNTNYYQVKKGEILKIYHQNGTNAAKYGFFLTVPSTSVLPDIYVPNTDETTINDIIIAPDDGYITLSRSYDNNRKCYKLASVQTLIDDLIFDVSAKTNQTYENLNDALTDADSVIKDVDKKGGMSIKFIRLTPATYTVEKKEGLTEQPTGTEVQEALSLESGTYTAAQMTGVTPPESGSVTYYLAVTVDETTTYTTWVITKATDDNYQYVQPRLMATSWSTDVRYWQGVDDKPVEGSNNLAKSKDVFNVNSQVELIKNLETLKTTSNINFETRVGTYYNPSDNSFYSNNNLNCFIADIQGYDKVSFLVSHITTTGRGWGILNNNNQVIKYVDYYTVYTEGQKVSVNLDDLDSPKTLIVTYRKTLQSQQYCEGINNISYPLIEEINRLNELIENKNSSYTFVDISNLTTICHQGRSAISCPSNSVHSITNAYMQGQKYVECDIKFTSDGVPVIMHDTTINATMQNVDGTPISGDIAIANYTLAELQANYVYKSSVAKYRTPITTLSEWIAKVKELSLIPLFHNLPISLLNTVIANFGDNFMYMGRDINTCKAIREAAPSCFIFFQYSTYEDNGTITNIPALINQMKDIKANAYSSLSYGIFTDEFINALTENGFYWQLSSQSSYEPFAVERGCKFLLSDNWYNDNLSYKSIYRMKDDLSNIDNVTEQNGLAVLQNGSTSTLPISSTLGSNIKVAITLRGTATISINNVIKNVGYDNAEKTFVVGRNVIAGDLTISITATSDIKIRELCVFEA